MDRRRFFSRTARVALGGAGLATAAPLAAGCASPEAPRAAEARAHEAPLGKGIGLQIGTLGAMAERDLGAALRVTAEVGYAEVELPRKYLGPRPAAVREMLRGHGLAAPSGMFDYETFRDEPERVAEVAQAIGYRFVVCPYFRPEDNEPEAAAAPLEAWQRTADLFERVGHKLRADGLQFAYHCHDHEFKPVGPSEGDRQRPLDVLLENTSPEALAIEMDIYWAAEAGADPLDYFARYPGRFPLWHVKDRSGPGQQAAVGAGTINFPRLFAQAEGAGLQHFFVEQGRTPDPVASIRASYQYLAQLKAERSDA